MTSMSSSPVDWRAWPVVDLGRALAAPVARWTTRIRSKRQIRRGRDELMALDERLLADIGLNRGDIAYAAQHGCLPPHVATVFPGSGGAA